MPSLAVSGNCSSEISKDRKKKKAKNAEAEAQKSPELDSSMEQKFKKEKKSKKTKISNSDSDSEELKKQKKKEKKRKAAVIDGDNVNEEERGDTSSELGEPMNLMKKKAKLTEVDEDDEEKSVKEEHPNALTKFRISERLREALKVKGIEYFFPIQAMTFDTILDGSDLVGRARTGQVYSLCNSAVFLFEY